MRVCPSIAVVLCLAGLGGSVTAAAGAPRIGAVDLGRLVKSSPQAQRAKARMARQFTKRKNALEARNEALQNDMDRLKDDAQTMTDSDRDRLRARIRDQQRTLQLRQSEYNEDIAAAEQQEFGTLRDDIRGVIDSYARTHDYDLILGNSVLYATDTVDLTDEILAQLKKN